MNGLSVDDEDIIALDGTNFSLYFDGSDVGLSDFTIDAFAIISETEILMSFTRAGSVPSVSGTVDDSDIVKFTATSLGEITTGSFTLYFDGSDVGLASGGEDVDSVELLPDGTLLLSTTGSFRTNGLSGRDEDILAFTPSLLGDSTLGSWALYFDGSDVALSGNGEDVDALAVSGGDIYLSTSGNFSTGGLSGADEDIFVCNTTGTGTNTSCSSFTLLFDGSAYGLGGNDIFAFDLP